MAETFDIDHSTEQGLSLKGRARLDNCVTVLDAAELFLNLDSIKSLQVIQHMLGEDTYISELPASAQSLLCRNTTKQQLRRTIAT